MANLTETSTWESGIRQLETTDLVQGGPGGIDNIAPGQLANRTLWLKNRILEMQLTPSVVTASATTNMAAGDVGKVVILSSGSAFNIAYNLVAPNAVSEGARIIISAAKIHNVGDNVVTITAASANQLEDIETGTVGTTFAIRKFDHVELISNGIDKWYIADRQLNLRVGEVLAFAANSAPSGALVCNGAAVSRTTYVRLYNKIGTTFGVGDGSSTFNLPDLRGEFIRGWDNSRGVDTDTITLQGSVTNASNVVTVGSTAGLKVGMSLSGTNIPGGATISSITNSTTFVMSGNATGTNGTTMITFVVTSRAFGSWQVDTFQSHTHRINTVTVASGAGTVAALGDTGANGGNITKANGSDESRPRNVALLYAIIY